jgi:hypothetical protein
LKIVEVGQIPPKQQESCFSSPLRLSRFPAKKMISMVFTGMLFQLDTCRRNHNIQCLSVIINYFHPRIVGSQLTTFQGRLQSIFFYMCISFIDPKLDFHHLGAACGVQPTFLPVGWFRGRGSDHPHKTIKTYGMANQSLFFSCFYLLSVVFTMVEVPAAAPG